MKRTVQVCCLTVQVRSLVFLSFSTPLSTFLRFLFRNKMLTPSKLHSGLVWLEKNLGPLTEVVVFTRAKYKCYCVYNFLLS